MSRKPRTQRALTMIEIMIVVGIILVLSVVLWFALGPTMKAKARESKIRSDLHQIVVAVNVYRSEYDDLLPLNIGCLPNNLPKGPGGEVINSPESPGYSGERTYYLIYNQKFANDMKRLGCKAKWEESRDAIVDAPFLNHKTGKTKVGLFDPRTFEIYRYMEVDDYVCLQGFLDGHVAWTSMEQPWVNELAFRSSFQK